MGPSGAASDVDEVMEGLEVFNIDLDLPDLWTGNIELALLDAGLSNRSLFAEKTSSQVLKAIQRYRDASGRDSWDDLSVLAALPPSQFEDALSSKLTINGVLRTDALRSAAKNLLRVGVRHASDVDRTSQAQRKAYCDMMGSGPVSWFYFTLLVGEGGVKADKAIMGFIAEALGRKASPTECVMLVTEAANRLSVPPTVLEHAIWRNTSAYH
ncbi:MAG: hypothetical protein ACOYEV_12005 [Candidatus Nanopelagicales bacterium]